MAGSSSLERYYNIVFDQAFSPSGKQLVTGDSFGQLAVFSLSSALSVSSAASGKLPVKLLKGHSGAIYCLEGAGKLLASGGADQISVWKWEELVKGSKSVRPVSSLQPPSWRFGVPETNALAFDKQTHTLYSGCGDSNIYAWDLETGQLKATYSGHSDYVHCLCLHGSGLVSGAEDGSVRIWDTASPTSQHTLRPSESGGWVGCVAVDGDWLVCGGSMAPCVYHLSSLSATVRLPSPDGVATQAAIFAKDRVITAGSESFIRHWSINGDSLASVPSGHQHAFSLAYNTHTHSHQYQVLTATGDSGDVDVFTNFGYKAFSDRKSVV